MPVFGDGEGAGQTRHDGSAHPPVELAARDEREDAERRDGVGHEAVNETEPHDFTGAGGLRSPLGGPLGGASSAVATAAVEPLAGALAEDGGAGTAGPP